jgi:hypothetical protein
MTHEMKKQTSSNGAWDWRVSKWQERSAAKGINATFQIISKMGCNKNEHNKNGLSVSAPPPSMESRGRNLIGGHPRRHSTR